MRRNEKRRNPLPDKEWLLLKLSLQTFPVSSKILFSETPIKQVTKFKFGSFATHRTSRSFEFHVWIQRSKHNLADNTIQVQICPVTRVVTCMPAFRLNIRVQEYYCATLLDSKNLAAGNTILLKTTSIVTKKTCNFPR